MSKEEYQQRYFAELEAQKELIEGIAERSARGETFTLLCKAACRDAERCHRTPLLEYLEEVEKRFQFPVRVDTLGSDPLLRLHDRLREADFDVICGRMELRIAPAYHTVAFSGGGVIRAVRGRGFEFALSGQGEQRFIIDLSSGANREHPEVPDERCTTNCGLGTRRERSG